MKQEIIVPIITAIFASIITAFAQPYITNVFEIAKIPVIGKEIKHQNVTSLPENVQEQIKVLTTRYALKHFSGGTGTNLTVVLKGSEKVDVSNLIISADSEKYSIKVVDDKHIEIDIPKLRQNAEFSLEIIHSKSNELEWTELIENGKIEDITNLQEKNSFDIKEKIVVLALVIFAFIIGGMIFIVFKLTEKLIEIETTDFNMSEALKKTIFIILLSLSVINTFINYMNILLPTIPLSDIFYALIIYLILTNLRHIKAKYLGE